MRLVNSWRSWVRGLVMMGGRFLDSSEAHLGEVAVQGVSALVHSRISKKKKKKLTKKPDNSVTFVHCSDSPFYFCGLNSFATTADLALFRDHVMMRSALGTSIKRNTTSNPSCSHWPS